MSLDISIDCGSAEREHGHLSSLEMLDLPVELAAQQKGKGRRGHSQQIPIWRLDSLAIKRDEVPS